MIQDRTERHWIAGLESAAGADIPAKFNKFFVSRKTIKKEFNGKFLERDEWVIKLDSFDDLLELRSIAPNKALYIGEVWDHPAVFL